jgi:hypothetical protein
MAATEGIEGERGGVHTAALRLFTEVFNSDVEAGLLAQWRDLSRSRAGRRGAGRAKPCTIATEPSPAAACCTASRGFSVVSMIVFVHPG